MGAIILSSFILALFMSAAIPPSTGKGFSPFELMWIVIFICALTAAFIEVLYDILGVGGLYENTSGLGYWGILIMLEITLAVAIPFFLIIVGLLTITLRFISAASSQAVPGLLTFISVELNNAIKARHDYTRAAKKNK
jgi:hypothetical protein